MTDQINRRVLIVDDELFMRKTVKSMLRIVGRFTVEEATDGAAALIAVARFRPDLVLCDIGMSPMGGIEFVEKLRRHIDVSRRATSVIMLTADANESTVLSASQLQLRGYLVKPVSPKQLGALIRTVFDLPDPAPGAMR